MVKKFLIYFLLLGTFLSLPQLCMAEEYSFPELELNDVKASEELPAINQIILNLQQFGFSDYVVAGIVGNIIVETGAYDYDINYKIYSSNKYYYGICQWNKGSYSEIHGAELYDQIVYIRDTIEHEIGSYMSYESFLAAESPSQAARWYAKYYERCSSSTYGYRAQWAEKVYEEFF